MNDFGVFGGCLRSALDFPELRPASTAPTWTLRQTAVEPSLDGFEHIGEDTVDAEIRVRAYRSAQAFALEYDDTGTFVITERGRDIHWWPRPGAAEPCARLDVLGRVLPLALHAGGVLTLHGSGVSVGGRGIAFLAPKYHGKSTLAYALVSAGASVITDDALAVETGPPATALPGVHCVRLFADSAARLGAHGSPPEPTLGKLQLDRLPDEQRVGTPVPLEAIYLLAPVASADEAPAVRRERLDSVISAMALVRHAKLGPLLGRSEAPVLFHRAAELAAAVPVYQLSIVRDLDRLTDAATRIAEWHSPAGAPA